MKKLYQVKFLEQLCKGCSFCVEFCPKKIITLGETLNNLGYHYASITNMNSCNGCGICAMMCPEVLIEIKEAV